MHCSIKKHTNHLSTGHIINQMVFTFRDVHVKNTIQTKTTGDLSYLFYDTFCWICQIYQDPFRKLQRGWAVKKRMGCSDENLLK